jgi:formate dehydrogenase major subunit
VEAGAAAANPNSQASSGNSQSASAGKGGGKDSEKSGEAGGHQAASGVGAAGQGGQKPPPMLPPSVAYDLSLQHPRSVFQLLKQQYSRYTPEMVERITGIPKDQFLKAADLFTSIRKDGNMKKAGTIIYAVGWTQHTFGTQIIRTAAILQLLLGNVGRAGGGVNALTCSVHAALAIRRVVARPLRAPSLSTMMALGRTLLLSE